MEQSAWSAFHYQWDVLAVVLRIRTKGMKVSRPFWDLIGQTIQVRKDRGLDQVVIEREDFRSRFDRIE